MHPAKNTVFPSQKRFLSLQTTNILQNMQISPWSESHPPGPNNPFLICKCSSGYKKETCNPQISL